MLKSDTTAKSLSKFFEQKLEFAATKDRLLKELEEERKIKNLAKGFRLILRLY